MKAARRQMTPRWSNLMQNVEHVERGSEPGQMARDPSYRVTGGIGGYEARAAAWRTAGCGAGLPPIHARHSAVRASRAP